VLEPAQTAEIRAVVPGKVQTVFVRENSSVAAGAALLAMQNVDIASAQAKAEVDLSVATANRDRAHLQYTNYGPALQEFLRARQVSEDVEVHARELRPVAPISGVVVTPHAADFEGQFVSAGTPIVTIEDTRTMKARLYVPEFEVRDVSLGAPVSLHLYSSWSARKGNVNSVGSSPVPLADGLQERNPYKGLHPPSFYVVNVAIDNGDGKLRAGMSGEAKIFVRRQSMLAMVSEEVRDFVSRRVW
jgi:multidrug efflux pump subunit AcrA (membrane-fusion protein)